MSTVCNVRAAVDGALFGYATGAPQCLIARQPREHPVAFSRDPGHRCTHRAGGGAVFRADHLTGACDVVGNEKGPAAYGALITAPRARSPVVAVLTRATIVAPSTSIPLRRTSPSRLFGSASPSVRERRTGKSLSLANPCATLAVASQPPVATGRHAIRKGNHGNRHSSGQNGNDRGQGARHQHHPGD